MKKNKIVSICVGMIVIVGMITVGNGYSIAAQSPFEEKVNKANELMNSNEYNVLARINDSEITVNDLEQAKIFRQDNISDIELLDILIDEEILEYEAQKRSIEVSDQEVKELVEYTRSFIESDKSEKEKIELVCEKLELTEDEYWNEYVTNEYKNMLRVNKVRQQLIQEYLDSNEDKVKTYSENEDNYLILQERIDELKSNYNIEILE